MRIQTIGAVCAGLLAVFVITSCDTSLLDLNSFDYELQGTWVTYQNKNECDGTLEIGIETIKITYIFTPAFFDKDPYSPAARPFADFTRGPSLTGYSEGDIPHGKIFIEDEGMLQEGIPYTYYTIGEDEFLLFTFGGREEKLKKE